MSLITHRLDAFAPSPHLVLHRFLSMTMQRKLHLLALFCFFEALSSAESGPECSKNIPYTHGLVAWADVLIADAVMLIPAVRFRKQQVSKTTVCQKCYPALK